MKYPKKEYFLIIVLFIFLTLSVGCGKSVPPLVVASATSWEVITLDSPGDVGIWSGIAIDGNGKAHIAYAKIEYTDPAKKIESLTDADLKYATDASGSWILSTLESEGTSGIIPRIAIDRSNKIHIIHTAGDLKYTTNQSQGWITTTIKTGEVKGTDPSIAVDSQEKIHISYYDERSDKQNLMYATNKSGSWEVTMLDSEGNVGSDGNIVLDSNNKVHICYLDQSNYDLKYATNVSGSWEIKTLDSTGNVGWNTSLAADKNGKVHISYSDQSKLTPPGGNGYLKYATNQSGSWEVKTLDTDNAGLTTSVAVGSDNSVHIAYYVSDGSYGKLKYLTKASESWESSIVDSGAAGVGLWGWMALDSLGIPHISYYDYGPADLKYARKIK